MERKKEATFRGKTLEELQKLEVRELYNLLDSRARRTVLRNFQTIENFVSRAKEKISKNKSIKTHSREMVVVPGLVGMRIQIHNGRQFVPIDVTIEMLGHRLGEFAPTRNR